MVHEQENHKPQNVYISSIAELVSALGELGEPKKGYSRFFRGHGNLDYQLQPSIYRSEHLIENEDKIIRDALTYCPDSFSENETLFEKLVKLQHYGYATRLLDLTENVLVALYFAISPNPNNDNNIAELIVLDIPEKEIKYSDSDTIAILSALSLQPNFDCSQINNELKKKYEEMINDEIESEMSREVRFIKSLNKIRQRSSGTSDELPRSSRTPKGNQSQEIKEQITQQIRKRWDKKYSSWFEDNWNSVPPVKKLLHTIRNDKPTFQPIIQSEDLQRILCVRAKLNNPRITRQQGLFLLFGIGENKSEQAKVNPSWIKSSEQRILIKPEHKENILKELRTFGITKQYLLPELYSQAQEIMNRYKPKKTKG